MTAIDTMTPAKALVLGSLLAAVNPKNLLLAASAGLEVGGAGLTLGQEIAVIAVFTVIAASTVLGPVIPGSLGQDGRAAEATSRMAGRQQRHDHGRASSGDRGVSGRQRDRQPVSNDSHGSPGGTLEPSDA
jgi:Sap, sulfolipid-1-addressing protein